VSSISTEPGETLQEKLGLAGSGTIACGLAAVGALHGEVMLWARSDSSAERARSSIRKLCEKAGQPLGGDRVRIVTDLDELGAATFLVEAIIESHDSKAAVLGELGELAHLVGADAVLATTTSSLSISELAQASGHAERFVGLHVFNPVTRMKLVELAFPEEASTDTRERAHALCDQLDKTAVEVPDIPGFVVNRLLFPYLFSAVELLCTTGMDPADIDRCMTLGAGVPMGPIALLDFVGLDVAQAIGEAIGAPVPPRLTELVRDGALGRKSRQGFYRY
jgi:3-hydroxybutyryl-CoA dehydrogenase